MKTNNLDLRNLSGGFIGGVLGILAASLIHTIALPFGCVLGVIIGYQWKALIMLPKNVMQYVEEQNHIRKRVHPMEKAKKAVLYGRLAGIATLTAGYATMVFFFSGSEKQMFGLVFLGILLFMFSIVGVAAFGDGIWPEEDTTINQRQEMSKYYKLINLHEKLGPILFVREFFAAVVIAIATPMALILFIAVLMIGTLSSSPLIAYWVAARGLYEIISRRNHLLCAIVTTIVTGITAYFLREYLSSTSLWLVAVLAGFLSGTVSLGAHALLQQLLHKQPWIVSILMFENPMDPLKKVYDPLKNWIREFSHRLLSPNGWQYHR